jgi:hypothetical protein
MNQSRETGTYPAHMLATPVARALDVHDDGPSPAPGKPAGNGDADTSLLKVSTKDAHAAIHIDEWNKMATVQLAADKVQAYQDWFLELVQKSKDFADATIPSESTLIFNVLQALKSQTIKAYGLLRNVLEDLKGTMKSCSDFARARKRLDSAFDGLNSTIVTGVTSFRHTNDGIMRFVHTSVEKGTVDRDDADRLESIISGKFSPAAEYHHSLLPRLVYPNAFLEHWKGLGSGKEGEETS